MQGVSGALEWRRPIISTEPANHTRRNAVPVSHLHVVIATAVVKLQTEHHESVIKKGERDREGEERERERERPTEREREREMEGQTEKKRDTQKERERERERERAEKRKGRESNEIR